MIKLEKGIEFHDASCDLEFLKNTLCMFKKKEVGDFSDVIKASHRFV